MTEAGWKRILLFTGLAFMLLFCTAPFAWMLIVSLARNPDFLAESVSYQPTLQNYIDVIATPSVHLLAYLRNSMVVSAAAALFAVLFASLAAYTITRIDFPGKTAIPLLMLALSMFPQISILGYLFKLMAALGWINSYCALVFPYITLGLPLALWIMISHFSQISKDLDHAALVDGATRLQVLRLVIFPIALPAAASTALLVFIYSFNEFLFALMFTVDSRARTIPVGIALFEGLHGQMPWGHLMAAAVVSTLPLLVLAAVFQQSIIQGLTRGAIKG